MYTTPILLAILTFTISVNGHQCQNPQIISTSYTTQDATVLKHIAYIANFYVKCNRGEPGNLYFLFGDVILPVAKVGPGKYQISWTEDLKTARTGNIELILFNENGYTTARKALRAGEDISAVPNFAKITINHPVATFILNFKKLNKNLRHMDSENGSAMSWENRRVDRGKVSSGLTHECGVFGAIGNKNWPNGSEIAQIICIGLEALQHRGQESTGIVTSEGHDDFRIHKGMGLVKHVFNNDHISKLNGSLGIGHTRYSTSARSEQVNTQPFVVHSMHGSLAVAHNGELVNAASLRKQASLVLFRFSVYYSLDIYVGLDFVLDRGVGLSTHSDSELITQALCLIPPKLAPLSYSLCIMLKDRIYAVRDTYGNRPLCLGKIIGLSPTGINGNLDGMEGEEGWVVSSESCAYVTATRYVREVLPGEILEMTSNGVRTVDIVPPPKGKSLAFCIFEYVYFEDQTAFSKVKKSTLFFQSLEMPLLSDIQKSQEQLCRRTFIQPSNRLRQLNVALKFSPILTNVKGKRIILIDDSIVRGNTVGPIIRLLRRAGAKEVHIRVASPPLKYPCYMGINIPTRGELIANKLNNTKELAEKVGADSLEYLSVEGLVRAVKKEINSTNQVDGHCTACLTGSTLEVYRSSWNGDFLWFSGTIPMEKNAKKIIDQYGADAVTALMPKVINALELLENLATKNERENTQLHELQAKISQLENDKLEKAEYRQKFEKELEAIEEQWRSETTELVTLVSRLQEENRRLQKEHSPNHTYSPIPPSTDSEVLQRLKDSVEKQRDDIRLKEKMLQEKTVDVDNLKSQVERLTNTSRELRRKHKSMQAQDQQRDISVLRQRLGLAQKENEDLAKSDLAIPSNMAVYDLDDPNRPRFTTQELKDILHERNELKARVSDLEDELETYRPKKKAETLRKLIPLMDKIEIACDNLLSPNRPPTPPTIDVSPLDEDAPVQGPLPY
ncbi:hypothetical protein NQ317_009378 [Molorchus minor]|uniref:Amidophosphoribosyltransferase n=1 Tax=Molorchus minor TaxID=1323400 RepID=A0ABQ9JR01_9CUCU|nr:hypothetical protein NQ317_009378 [Molorchus minor]